MVKKTILFKSKERKELANLSEFLHNLADKLAEGEIVLQQGEQVVELELPEIVQFEVEADVQVKKNKTKRSLELEIEWYEGDQNAPIKLG